MKKLINLIWSKKTETVEVPKWTSWEENERKYEARQYERQQVAKIRAENKQY
ncbi:hypothetical protein BIZ98_gp31 [Streptococcus phage 9874]|uniref:Uncharacterized protein n=1 Tax=Streptococcus phage 9874 TaxID=1814960 RepID=A0A191KBR2_9CAUD|nr:hypothetical protein BIZ98_gp31 [Streptococcus phage 9874]AMQ65872.1 hypothetical protein P9874_31 [Streptococcus phage 9874]